MGNTVPTNKPFPITSLDLLSWEIIAEDFVKYYIVITSAGIGKWAVKKRYSEIYDLSNLLISRYNLQNLPAFPPKKWIGSMETAFLSTRAVQLNAYLRALAEAMQREGKGEDADYCLFFNAYNPTFTHVFAEDPNQNQNPQPQNPVVVPEIVETQAKSIPKSEPVFTTVLTSTPHESTSPKSTAPIPEDLTCLICYERLKSAMFLPCAHICCCMECVKSSDLSECPVCRSNIESVIPVSIK